MNNKLILLTSSYPYGVKETYIENEIKFLAKGFDEVEIYPFYYNEGNVSKRDVPSNVRVMEPPIPITKFKRLFLFLLYLFTSSKTLLFIQDFLNNFKLSSMKNFKFILISFVDFLIASNSNQFKQLHSSENKIIYFYWGTNWSYTAPLLNETNKIFVRLHGGDVYLERASGYIPFRHKLYKKADVIISISKQIKAYFKNNYGEFYEKVIVSRLGTSPGKLINQKDNKKITIVTVSNVIKLKRLDLLIDAFSKINNLDISWSHFGDGPELENIKKRAQKKLPHNISYKFHGRVSKETIINYFKDNYIDCFINVSEYEGVPLSIMEAMSYGIPIIATDAGATRELVDDKNGLLLRNNFSTEELIGSIYKCSDLNWDKRRIGSINKWSKLCDASLNYSSLVDILKGKTS
tara:strand:+ start:12628 stop:13845 length:1218 start_codon:yes stop_codon:yes gene_type:complete